jgi:RND family efflux transporter MFP subunit
LAVLRARLRDEHPVEALELIDAGDRVVLGVRGPEFERIADVELPGQIFQVFTFRDGKIVEMRDFAFRADALAAGNVLSRAELDERRARFEVARAKYEKAKELRDRAVVRAPFAGVVSDRYVRIGQKVIEDESAPLFKITAFEPLLARVYLPEEDLLRVKIGDPVTVVPVKFPDARTTGRVQFISPTVDAASGTFQVIIRVRREPSRAVLRPGLAVKVQFTNKPRA